MAKRRGEHKPWTLEEALVLIRELAPEIRARDYHLCLGGSVLHTGESERDLDLFILPLNGYESNPYKILSYLMDTLGTCRALRDSPDYAAGEPWYFSEMQMFEYLGKRIDVFIR